MHGALALAGVVVGWLLVAFGALTLVTTLPMLYLLITGRLVPGEPYWDDVAPTTMQALTATLIECVVVATGLVVIRMARRYRSKEGRSPAARQIVR